MIKFIMDTTNQFMTIAISKNNSIIYQSSIHALNNISDKIIDTIEQSFTVTDIIKNDLDQLFVLVGPGSFTGIRIGVATLLGLSKAIQKPLYGISTLDAYALSKHETKVIAAIRLRGKEYVIRSYDFKNNLYSEYKAITKEELPENANIVEYVDISRTLLNSNLEKFIIPPVPFYFKQSEAEIKFDQKCC
ncbi:MAG: tRNA (adenosine(37)-N6)-threonylcarbamoyltransferase complex dimerization subunit type 1 TsaB [Calditerrivibrio sp.]|nr:tRNA (adenosine(37)-N6)-threonylcarbamoyltransferase complex dimerization subunit type 1 TsaB [Calditerrivibrio sp.]